MLTVHITTMKKILLIIREALEVEKSVTIVTLVLVVDQSDPDCSLSYQ